MRSQKVIDLVKENANQNQKAPPKMNKINPKSQTEKRTDLSFQHSRIKYKNREQLLPTFS